MPYAEAHYNFNIGSVNQDDSRSTDSDDSMYENGNDPAFIKAEQNISYGIFRHRELMARIATIDNYSSKSGAETIEMVQNNAYGYRFQGKQLAMKTHNWKPTVQLTFTLSALLTCCVYYTPGSDHFMNN